MDNESRRETTVDDMTEVLKDISGGAMPVTTVKSIKSIIEDGQLPFYSNFQGKTPQENFRLRSIACGQGVLGFDEQLEHGLRLWAFYVHPIEMVSKTGEIINTLRVALITDDEKCYAFVSEYLTGELDALRTCYGPGPWSPPVPIKVVKVKTRSKMEVFTIQPLS